MLSLCYQMFPRQRNLQLPLGNALVPPGVLLPPFNSLRNLFCAPQHGSGHPPHPHFCHLQSGLLQLSLRLAFEGFLVGNQVFSPSNTP